MSPWSPGGLSLASHPETGTHSVTPDAIRARVAASLRVVEISQSVETARTVRDAVAIALADAASAGDDITLVTTEYRRAAAALGYAESTFIQAMDELGAARVSVRLSA